jgi:hypothetical protein
MLKRRRYGLRKGSVSYLGTLEHCRCCWQGCLLLWTTTRKRVDSEERACQTRIREHNIHPLEPKGAETTIYLSSRGISRHSRYIAL